MFGFSLVGTTFVKRLSSLVLRRGFAWCVVLLGLGLVGRNLLLLVRSS